MEGLELTGKAKDAFERWFLVKLKRGYMDNGNFKLVTINTFYNLPESMQFGVLQEWADSIGYEIGTFITMIGGGLYGFNINRIEDDLTLESVSSCKSRQEARAACIKKLNQLINER